MSYTAGSNPVPFLRKVFSMKIPPLGLHPPMYMSKDALEIDFFVYSF